MPIHPYEVENAELDLQLVKEQFLLSWGWEQTCDTPGAYWLWRRDFADYDKKFGVQCVPTDLAISMTKRYLWKPEEGDD